MISAKSSLVLIVFLRTVAYLVHGDDFKPHMEKVRDSHFYGEKDVWGYAEVRPGAHAFWWLFYSTHKDGFKNRPLIIWLQGGPGLSGTALGNFLEIGPLDQNLKPRDETWVKEANVLFIDSPVGTGFSYHEDILKIDGELKQVSEDLINFLLVFTDYFPVFKKVPVYLFGQSYGGKYVSALAYYIHQRKSEFHLEVNLKGINIGNGYVSPPDFTYNYGPYLLQMGLIDQHTANEISNLTETFRVLVSEEKWYEAFFAMTQIFPAFQSVPGLDLYNVYVTQVKGDVAENNDDVSERKLLNEELFKDQTKDFPRFSIYDVVLNEFMDGPVREKLGIIPSNRPWQEQNEIVYAMSLLEFMKPVSYMVEWLLNNTDTEVNVYSGQFDFMCPTSGALAWVNHMQWPGRDGWEVAPRSYILDPETGDVETFVKQHGNLRFFWNLKAGHAVPADVPKSAMRMLQMILANDDSKDKVRLRKNLLELLQDIM